VGVTPVVMAMGIPTGVEGLQTCAGLEILSVIAS